MKIEEIKVLDFTKRGEGCTDHPVVRLSEAISNIKDPQPHLIVIMESDIPEKALKTFLERKGLHVIELRNENGILKALVKRL